MCSHTESPDSIFNIFRTEMVKTGSNKVTAINSKYQSLINRFLKWNHNYNQLVNLNHHRDRDTCPKQEKAYDKAMECWDQLPKREQQNVSKQVDTIGY